VKTMTMPGFTASDALMTTTARYQSATGRSYSGGGQRIIGQLRALGGFWECVACTGICTIFTGDIAMCYDACRNSGACESTAIARQG
jgi:hypothetical protein